MAIQYRRSHEMAIHNSHFLVCSTSGFLKLSEKKKELKQISVFFSFSFFFFIFGERGITQLLFQANNCLDRYRTCWEYQPFELDSFTSHNLTCIGYYQITVRHLTNYSILNELSQKNHNLYLQRKSSFPANQGRMEKRSLTIGIDYMVTRLCLLLGQYYDKEN